MSRKIFNIKKMNKTTSIFVGVLFSTLVLASCGGKKDEATAEAGAKTDQKDAGTTVNEDAKQQDAPPATEKTTPATETETPADPAAPAE